MKIPTQDGSDRQPGQAATAHPARTASRKSQIRHAFTLIELMVVVGIIAIICATALPPFVRAFRKEGLRKAVADMVEGCSHARAQAILHGWPTELIIRAEDGQISVRQLPMRRAEEGSAASESAPSSGPPPGGIPNFKGRLPDEIAIKLLYVNFQDQMEYPEAHVRFFPNGTCDEFTVILSSLAHDEQVSLDVITALADVKQIR